MNRQIVCHVVKREVSVIETDLIEYFNESLHLFDEIRVVSFYCSNHILLNLK